MERPAHWFQPGWLGGLGGWLRGRHPAEPRRERPGRARARLRGRRGGVFPLREDGDALARRARHRRPRRSDEVTRATRFLQPALSPPWPRRVLFHPVHTLAKGQRGVPPSAPLECERRSHGWWENLADVAFQPQRDLGQIIMLGRAAID